MTRRSLLWALLVSASACGGAAGGVPPATTGARAGEGGGEAADPGFADYAASHGIATLNGGGGDAPEVTADGLRLELLDKDRPVKLDGVPAEWPPFAKASLAVAGTTRSSMTIGLQYDDARLYVGADVKDASFAAGEDHASLVLAVPQPGGGYATRELSFFAGKPGESEGSVRYGRGQRVPGAKIVEAPTPDGYSFEAIVPWSALPEARVTRVGLHGVARYVEGGAVTATGPGDERHPGAMAWVPSEPELSMIEQLLEPKGLTKAAPVAELVADLTGDGVRERVAVFERYLTICGTSYMGGTGFFFRELGGELVKLDARDTTGRGRADVVVQRSVDGDGGVTREILEVLDTPSAAAPPRVVFSHEISVRKGDSHVDDAIRIRRGEIDVSVEPASGWDALSYKEPVAGDVEPILLPWGGVRSQSWRWDGSRFAMAREVGQRETLPAGARAAGGGPADNPAVHPAEPPTPKVSRGGNLAGGLLDKYRQDRGATAAPKVDLQVQVAGDARPERVLLIGRDIVVLGPGFQGGAAYAYVTLSQFADAGDISDLSARDLTGDGAADLVVRGVRRVPAGRGPAVESELLFVYQVGDDSISRIFAIETGREQAKKRVQGLVQFIPSPGGKSFDVLAAPGRAFGWTKKTYPWEQESPGSGDVEPLLLPWGGVSSVRYRWNGSAFAAVDGP